jgi:hypothetical protein
MAGISININGKNGLIITETSDRPQWPDPSLLKIHQIVPKQHLEIL